MLTYHEAVQIQRAQLQQWLPRLSAQCWLDLKLECMRRNGMIVNEDDGAKVFRGSDITEFVANWKPSN
jgi:hypothetical protein